MSAAGKGGKPPRSKREPFREPDPEQKVGSGNPPAEHRWPKGHCPNPAGRPRRKIQEMNVPWGVNPLQQMALEQAQKIVGELNGEPITRYGRLLATLEARAHEEPAIAKLLLETFGTAERETSENGIRILRWADEYKQEWGPVFERSEAAGRPPPPVYPHPDDVIITHDCSVKLDGPVTAQQARELDKVLEYRDVIFFVVDEILDYPDDVYSVSEKRKSWEWYRRKFYRIHRRIPGRLYKKFPKFRTTAREGAYDDDLEE